MGTRVVTVNDVLDGHVALDIECSDRIYLNGYVPILQSSGQVVAFLRQHVGYPFPWPALFDTIGQRFRAAVASFAQANSIPWVKFGKDDRKPEVMRRRRVRKCVHAALGTRAGLRQGDRGGVSRLAESRRPGPDRRMSEAVPAKRSVWTVLVVVPDVGLEDLPRWPRLTTSSRSGHSARTVCAHRSAPALALGARTGVTSTRPPPRGPRVEPPAALGVRVAKQETARVSVGPPSAAGGCAPAG